MKSEFGSQQPILILKPTFLTLPFFFKSIPIAVFLGLFGGFGALMISLTTSGQPLVGGEVDPIATSMFLVGGAGFFVLGFILSWLYQRTVINHTEYRIFPDRIEYFEGLFTVEQKTMKLNDITEIYLRKGMLQKRFNVGTIILMTKGLMLPMVGMRGKLGGMILHNIKNPDGIYQRLKDLRNEAQS